MLRGRLCAVAGFADCPAMPRLSVLLLALLLAACAGTGALLEARPVAVDGAAAARLVSAFRAEAGLGSVAADPALDAVAAEQALAMARRDRLEHSLGRSGTLPKRLAAGGYDWLTTAENIAGGYPTLAEAMAAWRASPGHRRNLLKEGVTEIGIGAAAAPGSTYRIYWALVLAAPRPPRPVGGPFGG